MNVSLPDQIYIEKPLLHDSPNFLIKMINSLFWT